MKNFVEFDNLEDLLDYLRRGSETEPLATMLTYLKLAQLAQERAGGDPYTVKAFCAPDLESGFIVGPNKKGNNIVMSMIGGPTEYVTRSFPLSAVRAFARGLLQMCDDQMVDPTTMKPAK